MENKYIHKNNGLYIHVFRDIEIHIYTVTDISYSLDIYILFPNTLVFLMRGYIYIHVYGYTKPLSL